ncbi:outer membrane protein assembly factor BamE [Asticcacaulis sp. EMRT-3]|uniref:outer membrane protein assembly factor BamE domain-containing protein n=1 Tax=Asticcacaulis sp. EMRT-3 TaxID=3040349 RepID=UPI0024AF8DC2|nr:outer membrane protein assembly factor BamE [Asticcacaulis sp. EMRT-3]MDI7774412.1 outer membrane protein assembly factor BamE [Asticcacaulis sp. EMRT-3]
MLPRMKTSLALAGAALLALGASACAPTMTHHGYLAFDAKPSTDIKVGDSQATVLDKLGAPSQTSIYDPNEWYYIDQVSMKMTYKKPHVTARSVTIIDFDKSNNTVSDVQTLSLADGRNLTPNPNKTPTRGRSLSAIEQLLGTVGHQRLTDGQDSDPGNNNHRRD